MHEAWRSRWRGKLPRTAAVLHRGARLHVSIRLVIGLESKRKSPPHNSPDTADEVRIVAIQVCVESVQDLAGLGQTALRVQDPALMSPDNPCYQPGIFFPSRVWNQTSRVTLSEYSRHVIKSEECNQAISCVCPRFIQSRCSIISQDEPERELEEEPPIFLIP